MHILHLQSFASVKLTHTLKNKLSNFLCLSCVHPGDSHAKCFLKSRTKTIWPPPHKNDRFCGGSLFFEIINFFLINPPKIGWERLMDISGSWQDGSLIVSICTPYRHIENSPWGTFLGIFCPFFSKFLFEKL